MSEQSTRAVLYARVSSDEQAKGYSLATQLDDLRTAAEHEGINVVAEITDDYTGSSLDRPGLEKVRVLVERSAVDVVMVYDLDRLARKAVHQMLLEEEFQKQDVSVYYHMGQYEDTAEGRLQKQIKAAVAEYEREKILERSKRGKRGRARAGYVLVSHAKCPYGYRYKSEPHKGYLVIHEPEAEIVRRIFDLALDGLSSYRIARIFNEEGLPAKKSKRWWHTTILKILHNETYAGVWHYNKTARVGREMRPKAEWIPVEVPAIVDRNVWEQAQRLIAKRLEGRKPKRYDYLLRGLFWCDHCGKRMGGSFEKGKPYYKCPRNKLDYLDERCSQPSVRADVLEDMIWNHLASLMQEPEVLLDRYRREASKSEAEVTSLEESLDQIAGRVDDARDKERRFAELYAEGHISKDHYLSEKRKIDAYLDGIEQERVALSRELSQSRISQQQQESFEEFCERVQVHIDNPSFETKRKVLSRLEISVRIADKAVTVSGAVPLGELNLGDKLDTTPL